MAKIYAAVDKQNGGSRARQAAEQSCSPGYRHQRVALRVGRRDVLFAGHRQLP
jgi:hypothetical protein